MGQKVSPIVQRLNTTASHTAVWYSDRDFKTNLVNDIKIREYIDNNLKAASVASVVIERNNKGTEVIVKTAKPGVVIGKSGEGVEKLKNALEKIVSEKINISIMEVKNPDLDATLVAKQIAEKIENRVNFRNAQKFAIRAAMKAGAKGVKTMVSGRLGGADMARSEGYTEGTIPLHTLRADIDYGNTFANSAATYGKIGVKVWIYKGEVLPTKKKIGGNDDANAEKN